MKFQLSTTGLFYRDKERMKKLEGLGFSFTLSGSGNRYRIVGEPIIEINTIQELGDFYEEHGEIIFGGGFIEIYDDYRE